MYKFTIIQQQLITEKKSDDRSGHRSDTPCLHPPVQHQETRYIFLVGRPGACRPEVEVVLKLVPGICLARVSESSCTDSTSPRWPSSWGWSWDRVSSSCGSSPSPPPRSGPAPAPRCPRPPRPPPTRRCPAAPAWHPHARA